VKVRAAVLAAVLLIAAPALASPPKVGGRAYYVQNASTGAVLLTHHPRKRAPIASITKLMTVLVALDHVRLGDVVTVTRRAAEVGESSIYLRPGDRLTVRELIEAALIQSANDAAVALATYAGGGSLSRFVGWMNAKARALGLRDTHFVNPDGLDARGHFSTARDVTRLAEIAMGVPVVRQIVRRTDATISGARHLHTWNDLLYTFPHLVGVKTGPTRGAGWSEVAAATSPAGTIYATLLGEQTRARRNADLTALLGYGLSRYRVLPVIQAHRVYASARTGYGKRPLELVPARPAVRVVRVDRLLVERVVAPPVVRLPVAQGQQLGEVRVYARGRLIARRALVASWTVSRPGLAGRVGWYAGRTFHHIWAWIS
jgi:serine-type D-Ala-D-Ala carboxypeptidase (penicillin-binding protein 5/6)